MGRRKKSKIEKPELKMAVSEEVSSESEAVSDEAENQIENSAAASEENLTENAPESSNDESLSSNEDSSTDDELSNATREMLRPDEEPAEESEVLTDEELESLEASSEAASNETESEEEVSAAPKKKRAKRRSKAKKVTARKSASKKKTDEGEDEAIHVVSTASKLLDVIARQCEGILEKTESIGSNLDKLSHSIGRVSRERAPFVESNSADESDVTPSFRMKRILYGMSALLLVGGITSLTHYPSFRERIFHLKNMSHHMASMSLKSGQKSEQRSEAVASALAPKPPVLNLPQVPSPESLIKKPSELARRHKGFRSRRGN